MIRIEGGRFAEIVEGLRTVAQVQVGRGPMHVACPVLRIELDGLAKILQGLLRAFPSLIRQAPEAVGFIAPWQELDGLRVVFDSPFPIGSLAPHITPADVGGGVVRIEVEANLKVFERPGPVSQLEVSARNIVVTHLVPRLKSGGML